MEKLHNDPLQGAKDVADQAKRQYSDGDYKLFRHEVLKELEKPKSSSRRIVDDDGVVTEYI